MNKQTSPRSRRLSLAVFFSICCVVVVLGQAGPKSIETKLPGGRWTLSTYPDLSAHSKPIPVVVSSITSDASRGGAVTRVGLLNRSSKPVTAIKLSWSLSTEDAPERILLQDETTLITLPETLQGRGKRKLDFTTIPLVTFAKIHKPLLKADGLSGKFRIDVVVSEAIYEDGSIWKRSEMPQLSHLKSLHSSLDDGYCPKQKCELESNEGGTGFTCKNTASKISCKNSVNSCEMNLCGGDESPTP